MANRRRARGNSSTFHSGSVQVAGGPATRSRQASAVVPSAKPTHRDRSSLIIPNEDLPVRVTLSNIEEQPIITNKEGPNQIVSGSSTQGSPPTHLTSVAQHQEEEVASDNVKQEHPQSPGKKQASLGQSVACKPLTTAAKRSVIGKQKQDQGKGPPSDVSAYQHNDIGGPSSSTSSGQASWSRAELESHLDPRLPTSVPVLFGHQQQEDGIAPVYHLDRPFICPEDPTASNAFHLGMSNGSHRPDMSYSAIQASPSMMNSSHSGLVTGPYASDHHHSQQESHPYPSSSSHPVYAVYSSGSGGPQQIASNNVNNGGVSAQYQAMYDVPPNGAAPSSSHQPLITPPNGNGSTRPSSSSSLPHGMPVMLPDQSAKHAAQMSGGKIFRCKGFEGCDMTFTRSEHLARHVRKHTGERPFPCHCHKSFSRLDNLRQHAATVHSDQADLNERMLRALAPVHAALSQRAGKEQKKRGEVLELPKQAKKSPTESWSPGGRPLPAQGGPMMKQELHESRPTSSAGPPGPGVVYNGQAYNWSQPAGAMVPPSPQTSVHGKARANSVSSHWDPQTSPQVPHYDRPSTAASIQYSDRAQGLMAAPQGHSHNRLPHATIPPRPSTSHAAPSARFGKVPQPSRPDSQFAHNPFPYGLRPAGGQTGSRADFTPRASSEAPGGNVVADAGYPPSSSGTTTGFNQQVVHPSWSYPPSGHSIQPMTAVEYNDVNPSYDSTPYVDSYGPPPPATAPSVFHFGPSDDSVRYDGQLPQQQTYSSGAGASGQQYSTLSGSSGSGGQSSRGTVSSGQPIPGAQISSGGMNATSSALRDIYGNPSSTSESPFSYHPPPTATQPPPAPAFSMVGQGQKVYPVSPSSSGSLPRKRSLSSREGYAGQPPVKMQRLDQQEMMGMPSSSSGMEMSGGAGGGGGGFAHAPPPQPTGTEEQWFPPRAERRSSLAIASLLSTGPNGPPPHQNDEYSYGPPDGQEEVWSGAGEYAYEVANVGDGQDHQHHQHQQQRGQHEHQHQMAAKAKALLGQYDG